MNEFKPTIGIEFDDKLTDATNKLIDLVQVLDDLTDNQRKQLANNFITSVGMANSFEQFANYMKNGGQG